jgi:hypothetical protein
MSSIALLASGSSSCSATRYASAARRRQCDASLRIGVVSIWLSHVATALSSHYVHLELLFVFERTVAEACRLHPVWDHEAVSHQND